MFFIASKLFWAVAQPVSTMALLLVLGLVLAAFRRRRLGMTAIGLSTLLLLVCAFTNLGGMALQVLENRFARPAAMPAEIAAIVVLGGGFDGDVSAGRGNEELNVAGDRPVEAMRLALLYPRAKVIVSGGFGSLTQHGETDAAIAPRFFAGLGLSADRLVVEGESRNTAENAALIKPLLGPGDKVLLVTSAFHMPRSMGLMHKAGIEAIAWPVDYRTPGDMGFGLAWETPVDNLLQATVAMREWVGLAAYAWSGQIDGLFPAPDQASN